MRSCLLVLLSSAVLFAQAGRWEGTVKMPDREIPVVIDLDQKGAAWIGSINVGPMNGLPLTAIKISGKDVSFQIDGPPGTPGFSGKIQADNQVMAGQMSAAGNSAPFSVKRTGDARVDVPAPSTALSKEVLGTWKGEISSGGQTLHLVLELGTGPDGIGTAKITSIDQGNTTVPATTVTQKDSHLHFEIKPLSGVYDGEVNAANSEITGTWAQGPAPAALKFVKSK